MELMILPPQRYGRAQNSHFASNLNAVVKLIYSLVFFLLHFCAIAQINKEFNIRVDGRNRLYILHTPPSIVPGKEYPLILVLHGGGGQAARMMRFSGFNDLADRENFFVAYPEGVGKNWRDGRIAPKVTQGEDDVDDVAFIRAVINDIESHHRIQTGRIFATGMSNGAMMSLYLAFKLSDKIRAIAPVCGNIPDNLLADYKPEHAVSVLLINGTSDKLVPYDGGPVLGKHAGRGSVVSTSKTIEKFLQLNHIATTPQIIPLPDTDFKDGCTAKKIIYPSTGNVFVELIEVVNGGHTWPGGHQYLPKMVVGKVCKDFKAEDEIWKFFKSQPPR